MAIIHLNFMSYYLMRTVDITVILPVDKIGRKDFSNKKSFQTLYLLHGVFGDCNDYIKGTRIALWAQEKNLAVVMPSGENKFYVDGDARMDRYSQFIGEELLDITRRCFPLSYRREDTFIGGLSMGGFGAMLNGFAYGERFSHIIGLSSAMIIDHAFDSVYGHKNYLKDREYFEYCFGEIEQLHTNMKNPENVIKERKKEKKVMPRVFMACGKQDSLYKENLEFYMFLRGQGVDATFLVEDGKHDWEFWDKFLKVALDWLPLEEAYEGIHSGHVE